MANLPPGLPEEELCQLASRYIAGEDHLAETLIEGLARYVCVIANGFAMTNRYLHDDLQGEALLALTQVMPTFQERAKDNQIVPYIGRIVRNHLLNFLRDRKREKEWAGEAEVDTLSKQQLDKLSSKPVKIPLELQEIVIMVANNALEIEIFQRAFLGLTDKEIGLDLNYTQQHIQTVRSDFFERVAGVYHACEQNERAHSWLGRRIAEIRKTKQNRTKSIPSQSVPTNRLLRENDSPNIRRSVSPDSDPGQAGQRSCCGSCSTGTSEDGHSEESTTKIHRGEFTTGVTREF